MKKIVSLVLALLMLMSLFSVSVFAEEEEKSELISFEETNRKETEHFVLTAKSCDSKGWRAGDNFQMLSITTKDDNIIITRIEAIIGIYAELYGGVGVSGTAKKRENTAKNGDAVHIDDINSNTFSFSGGTDNIKFKDITVYYKDIHTHNFDKDNKCTVCGKTRCEAEGHSYEKGVCTICEHKCENEFHNGVYECEECGMTVTLTAGNPSLTGSTLSEGNMTIGCTIAALAIGIGGGYFLGNKKKKPNDI